METNNGNSNTNQKGSNKDLRDSDNKVRMRNLSQSKDKGTFKIFNF
ncbi:MAG: hypothetical protein MJ252_27610 [archaeon]|nr:hypothetical protein [archaeon]